MKNRLIGMLLITPLVFTSCTKEVINNVDQAFSAVYTIAPGNWGTADGGLSYSVNLTVPELDNAILDNGAVDVYLSFDGGITYETVPEVFSGIAYGSLHQYHIVSIDLHAVDGSTITAPGGTILAKIVLIDATPL